MKPIATCLWFDTEAEEAANHYVSIFPNSNITHIGRYEGESCAQMGKEEGSVLAVDFELDGQPFIALNGGPQFNHSEAVSFVVTVESQEEVDRFWDALCNGGEESYCGWLKDRYGLSWQVVPSCVHRLLRDPDPGVRQRVMSSLMTMRKLILKDLEEAAKEPVA